MERALIIGDTGGIGSAVSASLKSSLGAANVVGLSRSKDKLDLTDPASVEGVLSSLSEPFDLVFVATGALSASGLKPEKSLKEISAEGFEEQFRVNALGPALVLRHAPRLLKRKERSVFASLSARVGSIGDNRLGGWYSYRASKAALNQILHCAAIELSRTHRNSVVVALHPGTVATQFTKGYQDRHPSVSPDQSAQNLLHVINNLSARDTGKFFDWAGAEIPW